MCVTNSNGNILKSMVLFTFSEKNEKIKKCISTTQIQACVGRHGFFDSFIETSKKPVILAKNIDY